MNEFMNKMEMEAVADAESVANESKAANESVPTYSSSNLLNCDDFEKYIAVGTSMDDLMKIFLADKQTMEKWCRDTYGLDFKTAYGFFLTRALAEYKSCLSGLAQVGNSTAMNTINQLTLNLSNTNEVRINVCASIPKETDND